MHKVKFTRSAVGCPDGIRAVKYDAGSVHEINDSLYKSFVEDMQVAVSYDEEKSVAAPPENKALGGAPMNKALMIDDNDIVESDDESEDQEKDQADSEGEGQAPEPTEESDSEED